MCVGGYFFLIFIVKCAKFVTCAEAVPVSCTLLRSSRGACAAAGQYCAFKGEKKKKKIRSLRSDDILVTPNFRENHRGRREGANNAIFRVIVPYFIFSARGHRSCCPALTGSTSGALPRNNNV